MPSDPEHERPSDRPSLTAQMLVHAPMMLWYRSLWSKAPPMFVAATGGRAM